MLPRLEQEKHDYGREQQVDRPKRSLDLPRSECHGSPFVRCLFSFNYKPIRYQCQSAGKAFQRRWSLSFSTPLQLLCVRPRRERPIPCQPVCARLGSRTKPFPIVLTRLIRISGHCEPAIPFAMKGKKFPLNMLVSALPVPGPGPTATFCSEYGASSIPIYIKPRAFLDAILVMSGASRKHRQIATAQLECDKLCARIVPYWPEIRNGLFGSTRLFGKKPPARPTAFGQTFWLGVSALRRNCMKKIPITYFGNARTM